ncbi:MAG: CPBP family intramembrane metalloprotease, partial [Syntrophales bacterium LBB04]|nr:CPBP family intramembrane metalloprotease [Syntrophales bacterium LBB04]
IGVSPLFFTSGTPLKMMALSFYTFALPGALGAAATFVIVRSSWNDKDSFHFASPVIIWSCAFGIAALAATVVGEGLSMIIPAWIAWAIAFEAMALIMGGAGGYAIVKLLGTAGPALSVSAENRRSAEIPGNNRCSAVILLALCLPFYLNDLSDIFVTDWRLWILIDYVAVKLFPCFVIFWLILKQKMDFADFGLNIPPAASFLTVFFISTLIGIFIDQNGYHFADKIHGYQPLGGMPEIASPLWKWIDLTVGLLMTGICEEMVFRGYLRTFLSQYTKRASAIVLISALAFGLIHWSGGFSRVLVTSVVGAVFMLLYLRTSSLPAIMAAHFAINCVDYANIVPKYIFRFL